MRVLFLAGLLLFSPILVRAQVYNSGGAVLDDITLSAETGGVSTGLVLFDAFRTSATVEIDSTTSAHCVWVIETSATCTTVTTAMGKRLCRKSGEPDPVGWEWNIKDGYYGQICVIGDAGTVLKRSRR